MQNPLLLGHDGAEKTTPTTTATTTPTTTTTTTHRGHIFQRSVKSTASAFAESLVTIVGSKRAGHREAYPVEGWGAAVKLFDNYGVLLEALFILVLIANTVVIIANAGLANHDSKHGLGWIFTIDTLLLACQVCELCLKAIAYHPKRVFTDCKLFWLDSAIIATAIVSHVALKSQGFQILRAFRLLKVFDSIKVYSALVDASGILAGNTFFFMFFWVLFAVSGIQMFSTSLRRVCQVGIPADFPTHHTAENSIGYATGGICTAPSTAIITIQEDPGYEVNMTFLTQISGVIMTGLNRTGVYECEVEDGGYPFHDRLWSGIDVLKRELKVLKVERGSAAQDGDNSTTWENLFPRRPCKVRSDCPNDDEDFLGESAFFEYRCATVDATDLAYGYISFDTVASAMLTVLQITTLADWGVVSFWLREAEGSIVVPIWSILLISTMTFIVVNLNISIVQVVYESQEKPEKRESDATDVTSLQSRRGRISWDIPGVAVTVLYAVSQASRYRDMSDGHLEALSMIELGCLIVLTAEGAVKIALGGFRFSKWDVFDVIVFTVAWVNRGVFGQSYVLILHLCRAAELALKTTSDEYLPLRILLQCTGNSLPPTCYVIVFLLFTTLLFAAVSVNIFSATVPSPPLPCPHLSPTVNPYYWAAYQSPGNSSYRTTDGCVASCHPACAEYSPWEGNIYDTGGSTCPMWPPGENLFTPPETCGLDEPVSAVQNSTTTQHDGITCPGWDEELGDPRMNFNSFWGSAITLFIMTTGDDWVYPMYHLLHCADSATRPLVVVFCISYFMFTNFILLNLFTAVVVEQFKVTDLFLRTLKAADDDVTKDVDIDQFLLGVRPIAATRRFTKQDEVAYENDRLERRAYSVDSDQDDGDENPLKKRFVSMSLRHNCLLFPPNHPYVIRVRELLKSDWFERAMIFCILGSCLAAVWEPNRPNIPPTCTGTCVTQHLKFQLTEQGETALFTISVIFTTIFSIEAVLKMVANGVILGSDTYFGAKDHSDKLDFFILVSMVLSLTFAQYRYLKIIRAYRPLRLFNKIQILKVLGSAVRKSLKPIGIAIGVGVGVFFVFGIIGMQMFMGRLGYCTDSCVDVKNSCVGVYEKEIEGEVMLLPKKWKVPHSHFDHIGATLLTLCEVASQSDWKAVMYTTMDIVEPGQQPRQDASPWNALYFVSFVFTCGFLLVSVFISIIMENINAQRGVLSLTAEQNEWVSIRKDIVFSRPELHNPHRGLQQSWRRSVSSKIVRHKYFEWGISLTVVVNICILAFGEIGHVAVETVSHVCLAIFVVEAWLKISALGGSIYFRQARYKIEFLIVVVSLLGIALDLVPGVGDAGFISAVGKASRIARIFRLTSLNDTLSMFFATFVVSLPSIVNVSFLLVTLLMVYGYLGGYAFGNVRDRESVYSMCNFRTFGSSFFTLFRALTLDDWNGIMWDTAKKSGCTTTTTWTLTPSHPNHDLLSNYADHNGKFTFNDCGSPAISFIFFITFYVLGHYVVLDLVVAVVLDCFSSVTTSWQQNNPEKQLWAKDMAIFRRLWSEVDIAGVGVVSRHQLLNILNSVETRCGRLSVGVGAMRRSLVLKEVENLAGRKGWVGGLLKVGGVTAQSRMSAKGYFKYGYNDVLQVVAMHSTPSKALTPQARRVRAEVVTELYCQVSCDVLLRFSRGFVVRVRFKKLLEKYNVRLRGGDVTCSHSTVMCSCWQGVHAQLETFAQYELKAFYHILEHNVPLHSQAYSPALYRENLRRMTILNCAAWIPDHVAVPEASIILSRSHRTDGVEQKLDELLDEDDDCPLFGDVRMGARSGEEDSVDNLLNSLLATPHEGDQEECGFDQL